MHRVTNDVAANSATFNSLSCGNLNAEKTGCSSLDVGENLTVDGDVTVIGDMNVGGEINIIYRESEAMSNCLEELVNGMYTYRIIPASYPEIQLRRLAVPAYEGGDGSSLITSRPNPRDISNAVVAQPDPETIPNPKGATDLFWLWGQFVDHDLDLTEAASPVESAPIAIPSGDPQFDPGSTGTVTLPFSRSIYDATTGTDGGNPRQQLNEITSELDATGVYGSVQARNEWLRTGINGKLKISGGGKGCCLMFLW